MEERQKYFVGDTVMLVATGRVAQVTGVVKAACYCYYLDLDEGYYIESDLRLVSKGMEKVVEKIPTWALCYISYGDTEGITELEKEMVDEFFKSYETEGMNVQFVSPIVEAGYDSPHEYFTAYPAFGQPCMVEDCNVFYTTE